MLQHKYWRNLFCCAWAAFLCSATWSHLSADDAVPQQPKTSPATPPDDPQAAPADPFAIPESSEPIAVQMFVRGLVQSFKTRGAEFRSEEGTVSYLNKMDESLTQLQERKLDEAPAVLVANIRRQVLSVLQQLEAPTSDDRVMALIKTLKGSDVASLKALGERFEVSDQIERFDEMTPEQRTAVVQTVADGLKVEPLNKDAVDMAMEVGGMLQDIDQNAEAVVAYNQFAKVIEDRKAEELSGLVESFKASARFAGLLGNPIEIKGLTVDGQPFDIAQFKGKVVLVDFWATWCGPCIGELPNVKQNYERYHSKGFEVVGISLDNDADRLKDFLEQEQIGWVTLFPADEGDRGWNNPIARYYGINGIPAVILVNQEGKVVNLAARGPALGAELEKLLGPADTAAAQPGQAPAESPKP
ncbi:MAG: TlpA family protein disulfide reductase [Planctomycetaceae bacterium]